MAFILQIADNLFSSLPPQYRSLAAIVLLILLFFSAWRLLKGYFVYIILILILIPGVWPAFKIIGKDIITIVGYLLYRM